MGRKSFNGGILCVDSAIDKLRKLLHECRALENNVHYFCKNSCAAKMMTFQRALICQQNLKQLTFRKQLHRLSERVCTSPVQGEINPEGPNNNQRLFTTCLLH